MKILFVIVIIAFAVHCVQKTIKLRMLPAISTSDSAVIMYYHEPGNPRFFNMVKIPQKQPLSWIAKDANEQVIEARDSCVTDGKIYFYGEKGAVETIYFSRNNDCRTLSFIKTGEKYYTAMSETTKNLLDSLEKKATILPGKQ